MSETARAITHARVARIALPVVLSNATAPLQGAIDTAIIGNQGEAVLLAAVVLGATVVSLLLGTLNFVQLSASGLTAEALGAGNRRRVTNTLLRALMVAGALGIGLILLAWPLSRGALMLYDGSPEAEALAGAYIRIRLIGAPAELANYALIGWFTGLELTRRLFEVQIATSVVNIALNLLFVPGFGWGVEGVAAATAIAGFAGLGVGLWRARAELGRLRPGGIGIEWPRLLDPGELGRMVTLNRDIFLRTLCLTGGFAWFARLGSLQGDTMLAANGVLLQLVVISAHALDGFAMAAETLVGQSVGARDRAALRRAVLVTGSAALMLAAALAAGLTAAGPGLVALFTNVPEIRAAAGEDILWASLLPLVGVLAYQLDGVFIGAAEARRMRDAMIAAVALYLPIGAVLSQWFGNDGVWLALWLWMVLRAAFLGLLYPRIEAGIATGSPH